MSNSESKLVFTKYITVKGRRIYASQYGLKAFCFEAKAEQSRGKGNRASSEGGKVIEKID